jgi:hydroxymethylpyrimidine pyrophosphatase-like HAD family hydrolase
VRLGDITKDTSSVFAVYPTALMPQALEVVAALPDVSAQYNLYDRLPNHSCVQIVEAGVNKGYGARRLLELDGIAAEEAVAIGDGDNDDELFAVFAATGGRIAMGNATPGLKAKADRTVGSVDRDGFAEMMQPYLAR